MKSRNHTSNKIFFDGEVGVQRFETVKYKQVDEWNETGLAQFWRPEEVDITKDADDFKNLLPHEQHIFTANLQRQVVLDTVMGREPIEVFSKLISLPEFEIGVLTWQFQEGALHSRSYTHIIRNVYSNPSGVLDQIEDIDLIMDLADEIQKYYDNLAEWNFRLECHERGIDYGQPYDQYEHKKALWLALVSANALESVRFYVSFACSYAFAEIMNKMEGNAKIIKLINRDENEHLDFAQMCMNLARSEDEDFQRIHKECEVEAHHIYNTVVKQEKQWSEYLFKDGDILGLNVEILGEFVDLRASIAMEKIGYTYSGNVPDRHPIPWIEDWINSGRKQNALQETENDSYLLGITEGTVDVGSVSDIVNMRLKRAS